jgi:4-azaleucine resistance transporter AzlC
MHPSTSFHSAQDAAQIRMLSSRTEFLNGCKAELPILLGDLPFGMFYGVLALQAGLPPVLAWAMSSIVFAGSAQFIGMQLIAQGAGGLVIVATTFVVNLRHALYSASMAPFIKQVSLRWKVLLAYLLTDEAYAVTITRFTQPDSSTSLNKHWYYFGAGITLWTSWQLSTAVGIIVGQLIPESWSLDFTLALTFIALVVPNLKDRASVAAAVSAGIMAAFSYMWPYKLGLFAAAITGIVIGMLVELRKSRSPSPDQLITD